MKPDANLLTENQKVTILMQIEYCNTPAIAARMADTTVSVMNRVRAADEDFNEQYNEAVALFRDNLHLAALTRAKTSDTILKVVLEASHPDLYKTAPVDPKAKGKPTGLVLASFEEDENGEVKSSVGAPSEPREPIQLGYDKPPEPPKQEGFRL